MKIILPNKRFYCVFNYYVPFNRRHRECRPFVSECDFRQNDFQTSRWLSTIFVLQNLDMMLGSLSRQYDSCSCVSEQKFMFQIGIILPMVLTNAFHSTNLFLEFIITLYPAVNIALFSAYKTHPNCISSNYIIFSLLIRFLFAHSLDKTCLFLACCSIFLNLWIQIACTQ